MIRLIIISLFLLIPFLSQTQNYVVTQYQDSFSALQNANSIIDDFNLDDEISGEEAEISFGFNFPYFDTSFTSVFVDGDGFGYFSCSSDYNINLFAAEYGNFAYTTGGGTSDWLYQIDSSGINKILKLEWNNVGVLEHIDNEEPYNHTINFQTWFYENGDIEIHFGELDLVNTNNYVLGQGFIWDDNEVYGPWIEIGNCDFSEYLNVYGNYQENNISLNENNSDVLFNIPPNGWVIKFSPVVISTNLSKVDTSVEVRQSNNMIYINGLDQKDNYLITIFDLSGRLSHQENYQKNPINIENLPPGVFILHVNNETTLNQHTFKVFKN